MVILGDVKGEFEKVKTAQMHGGSFDKTVRFAKVNGVLHAGSSLENDFVIPAFFTKLNRVLNKLKGYPLAPVIVPHENASQQGVPFIFALDTGGTDNLVAVASHKKTVAVSRVCFGNILNIISKKKTFLGRKLFFQNTN